MSRRTIEISGFDSRLSVRYGQVQIIRDDLVVGQFPAEDVGLLITDARIANFSSNTLVQIAEAGGLVVCCDDNHLPAAMVIPVAGHHLHFQRLSLQTNITAPARKRLWQEIVQAKLSNQAYACDHAETSRRLTSYAGRVQSGDAKNVEAQGARLYWSVYLDGHKFKRDRDGAPPNLFLNYGYMILRAAVARSLYGAGLNPAFGLHHASRSNAFCLADDLMEPFRPWADLEARDLFNEGKRELTKEAKARLIGVLYNKCAVGDFATTLQVAADYAAKSLVRRLEGDKAPLHLPRFISQGEKLPDGPEADDDEEVFRA